MLFERKGSRLYERGTDNWLAILSSDNLYPEAVLVEDAAHAQLVGRQLAPNLYMILGRCLFQTPYQELEQQIASKEPNSGGEKRIHCQVCSYWVRDYELLKQEMVKGRFKHCPLQLEAREVPEEAER